MQAVNRLVSRGRLRSMSRPVFVRMFSESTKSNYRIAVVGSGPAGFYTAKYLFQDASLSGVTLDMFDALATPYGLVRSGVAPDHPEVKLVQNDFAKVATDPRYRFFGNVTVGEDLSIDNLKEHYDILVLCYGASGDRALGLDREDELEGVHSARAFVNWYNGHPDFADAKFNLQEEVAVVIGNGNVAIDVARILCTPVEELAKTDIADHAVQALSDSKVKEVHVVGRRGPAQAAFTIKEARELTRLPGVDVVVKPEDMVLNEASQQEVDKSRALKRKNDLLKVQAETKDSADSCKSIHFDFFMSPCSLEGQSGKLERVQFRKTELTGEAAQQKCVDTDTTLAIDAGLLFRSIGYKSVGLPGLPFDDRRAVIPNTNGRVMDGDSQVSGVYVAGWLKRGPSGIVGTNIQCAKDSVKSILADIEDVVPKNAPDISQLLQQRGVQVVDQEGWLNIDKLETARGESVGKPREKLVRTQQMLDAAATPRT